MRRGLRVPPAEAEAEPAARRVGLGRRRRRRLGGDGSGRRGAPRPCGGGEVTFTPRLVFPPAEEVLMAE